MTQSLLFLTVILFLGMGICFGGEQISRPCGEELYDVFLDICTNFAQKPEITKPSHNMKPLHYPIPEGAQDLIRPVSNQSLMHTPSTRLRELACPKWPYYTQYGTDYFHFIPRGTKIPPQRLLTGAKEVLSIIPCLKPTDILKPMPKFYFRSSQEREEKEPKLVIFPPIPTADKARCSKRLSNLAKPRQNWMEVRKKQLEEQKKVYAISKSALEAVPSHRIITLARSKYENYSKIEKEKMKTTLAVVGREKLKSIKPHQTKLNLRTEPSRTIRYAEERTSGYGIEGSLALKERHATSMSSKLMEKNRREDEAVNQSLRARMYAKHVMTKDSSHIDFALSLQSKYMRDEEEKWMKKDWWERKPKKLPMAGKKYNVIRKGTFLEDSPKITFKVRPQSYRFKGKHATDKNGGRMEKYGSEKKRLRQSNIVEKYAKLTKIKNSPNAFIAKKPVTQYLATAKYDTSDTYHSVTNGYHNNDAISLQPKRNGDKSVKVSSSLTKETVQEEKRKSKVKTDVRMQPSVTTGAESAGMRGKTEKAEEMVLAQKDMSSLPSVKTSSRPLVNERIAKQIDKAYASENKAKNVDLPLIIDKRSSKVDTKSSIKTSDAVVTASIPSIKEEDKSIRGKVEKNISKETKSVVLQPLSMEGVDEKKRQSISRMTVGEIAAENIHAQSIQTSKEGKAFEKEFVTADSYKNETPDSMKHVSDSIDNSEIFSCPKGTKEEQGVKYILKREEKDERNINKKSAGKAVIKSGETKMSSKLSDAKSSVKGRRKQMADVEKYVLPIAHSMLTSIEGKQSKKQSSDKDVKGNSTFNGKESREVKHSSNKEVVSLEKHDKKDVPSEIMVDNIIDSEEKMMTDGLKEKCAMLPEEEDTTLPELEEDYLNDSQGVTIPPAGLYEQQRLSYLAALKKCPSLSEEEFLHSFSSYRKPSSIPSKDSKVEHHV